MTTDGGAQAMRDEIEQRWWGVHTAEDARTGQITYGATHRHAGADIGWLLQQYDALAAQVAALKAELTQGTIGTLTAELAEAVQEQERLREQIAALTAERERLRAALTEHAVWRDWEGSDNYRCRICRDGAPKRDLILHALTCPLRVLSLAEWLDRRATTPPAGAQGGE